MFGRRGSASPQPSTSTHSNFSLKRRLSLAHIRRPSTAHSSAPPLIVSASTFQPIAMPTTTATFQPPPLPSTTNLLRSKERADLVRRTRKLEQVLGVAMHVVEVEKAVEEAPPSASGADGAHSDRIEISDASSTSNASAHVPRRRLKSLRRPSPSSRPVIAPAPTGGVLISTSTQVHVDEPSETTVVVSPPPGESTLPWYCTPFNMDDDDQDESSEQQDSVVVRSKQSLVFSSSSQSLLGNDLPTTSTPTTTTSYVFPSPMSSTTHLTVQSTATAGRGRGRDRSSSVTSTATLDSIASTSTFILPDPRQRQVNQALKLQRRLGETIPPELLTGSQPSPSSNDLASSVDSASSKRRKVTHKSSLSLRIIQKKKPKHQQVQVVVETADATRSVPERSQRRRSHRRVHSDDASGMKLRVVNSEADLPAACRSPSRGTDWTSTVATLPPAWASDIVLPTRASKSMDVDQDSESRHLLAASPTTPMAPRRAARSLDEDDEVRRMTPKEKSLNVRRAQKMTKKFGQAPPHALFQITTNNASSTKISINIDLELSSTTSSLRRHSTTYTLSVPRSPAASSTWSFHGDENDVPTPTAESDPSSRVRRRSSLGSFIPEANVVRMGLGDSSSQPSRVKSIPSPIVVEFPDRHEVGVVSPTTTAVTPTTPKAKQGPLSPLKLAQVFEPPAIAPPSMPLSNVNGDPSASDSGAVGPARRKRTLSRSQSQSFATKRRQATKLTKFFGVEYPDLYQAMILTTTTTTTTTEAATASTTSLATEETRESAQKKPAPYHYQKVTSRTRKSSDAALPSRPPAPPPSAFKKRKSVVAGLTSSSNSSSLKVGVDDSCRWSAKGPEEVEELMTKLRAMKA